MTKQQTWCVIALFAVLVGAFVWKAWSSEQQKKSAADARIMAEIFK